MRIYLVGYMGSGKTTVGKRLAKQLEFEFLDLDELFEGKYCIKIADFFEKYDESAFRSIEAELIRETGKLKNSIISTGGGGPIFNDNMKFMNQSGLTVYLKMSPISLTHRLSNAKETRPLIKELNETELEEFIINQLSKREVFYNKAHIVSKGESCEINTLVQSIKSHPLFK
ncbi:MAG: shikimate kinase [Bacteroidetes bacterium]|nr:shikimate kinase [Bacteroidota bacterium]